MAGPPAAVVMWRAVLCSPAFAVAVFLLNAAAALLPRASGNEPAAYLQLGVGAAVLLGIHAPRRRA